MKLVVDVELVFKCIYVIGEILVQVIDCLVVQLWVIEWLCLVCFFVDDIKVQWVVVEDVVDCLVVIICGDELFVSVSVSVCDEFQLLLLCIVDVLCKVKGQVLVIGYSDNWLIVMLCYLFNWKLFQVCVQEVVDLFGVIIGDVGCFIVEGCSDIELVVINVSVEGCVCNCWVEIIVFVEGV